MASCSSDQDQVHDRQYQLVIAKVTLSIRDDIRITAKFVRNKYKTIRITLSVPENARLPESIDWVLLSVRTFT